MKSHFFISLKYLFLNFLFVVCFQSCIDINLKSNYPEIKYYKLSQTPTHTTDAISLIIDKSIYIKIFATNSDLATSKIIVSEDNWTTKRYNYHQWISPLNELLTDFTVNRMSKYGTFRKGILNSTSLVNTDLVLECTIVDFVINNSTTTDRPNNVELAIAATLLTSNRESLDYIPIFSKTYSKSLARKDNSMETAVDALSKIMAEINDEMIIDIYNNVVK